MNMTSHGIPDPFGYDEHRDIASYSQTLDSGRSSYHIAHAKYNSQGNTFSKVTAANDELQPGNTLKSSCKDVTDDPFSCTFDEILDLEESQILSPESHNSSLYVNSFLEDSDFSPVAGNHDCNNQKSKPNRELKCSSVLNEKLLGSHQSINEPKVGNCASDVGITVNVNPTSNMPDHVRIFASSPLLLEEHRSIKNMAQCIQEPELMNRHENSSDIRSCEHALMCKLSHRPSLQSYGQQYKPCLPYNAATKINSFLENNSSVAGNHDCSNLKSKPSRELKCRTVSNEKLSGAHLSINESEVGNCTTSGVDITVNVSQTSNMSKQMELFASLPLLDEHHSIKNMAHCIHEPELMNRQEDSGDKQSCEHALIGKLSHSLQSYDQQYKPCLPYNAVTEDSELSALQPHAQTYVLEYAEANHAGKVDVMRQSKNKSGAKGIGHGAICGKFVSDELDPNQNSFMENSKESASNVSRESLLKRHDNKGSISAVDSEHAGGPSLVEILPDRVTGTPQSISFNDESVDPRKSVNTSVAYQQNEPSRTSHVSTPTDAKATETTVHLSSSRGCQRDDGFGVSGGIHREREVSSHLKNVDKETETTDQLKHCEVSSMATSETIQRLENDKFPDIFNINQLHERSRKNYELIIQEHGQCNIACVKQDIISKPHSIDNNQSSGLDSSINGMEIPQVAEEKGIGVRQDWIPVSHKLAMFENSCHVTENDQKSAKLLPNTGDTHRSSLIQKDADVNGISIVQNGRHSKGKNMRVQAMTMSIAGIPSSRTISSDDVFTPLPSPVSPVAVKCKESSLQPGQLTSTHALNSTGMSKNKVTFEQRREKELDDILHVLQATVQKMEEDCFDGQSSTWRACSQSANLMDSRSHCFSLTSDAMSEDDLPPLPPPPPIEDLASFDNSPSSSLQIKSPPPANTVISPTYKASANFNVWTPGGGVSKDGQNVRANSKATTSTAPTGFRSVSRPVLKKSDGSPASSTVSTSYQFPGKVLPETSGNIKITPNHELPHGAVYETKTVDGDMVHTDTYYPAPGESTVLERTKKTTVVKAEHHHGMGPTSDSGVPTALRSTVDNPKAWYKNMFKQIHKLDQEDEKQSSEITEASLGMHDKSVVPSVPYKSKKLGRITDYTPQEPYVVESKPNGDRIPPSSTSFKPSSHQYKVPEIAKSQEEPVHGTEYAVKDYALADHVVMEPKHVVTMHPSKPKETKQPESKRLTAQAKFDFVAQSSKQLGFKRGQIVIITKEINKDWYEGETADRKSTGMFPVAYVEVLSQTERKSNKKGAAKAKFDFNGTNPKQLSIKKGDAIQLLEKVDKNWYKAVVGQRTGIVPSNYIEVISEPEGTGSKPTAQVESKATSPLAKEASSKTSYQTTVPASPNGEPDDKAKMSRAAFLAHQVVNSGTQLSKPRTSHGEFDIPELSDESLGIKKQVHGKAPIDAVASSSSNLAHDITDAGGESMPPPVDIEKLSVVDDAPPSALPDNDVTNDFTGFREKFIAIYQYLPQNEDELELLQGDSVLVVEKCDDGWFVGTCERTGAFGTFPGNYVSSA